LALQNIKRIGELTKIKDLNKALTALNKKHGWDIGIHIDAASGGFVAPFIYPDLEWDFRLPLVRRYFVYLHTKKK
jgi:glutamate decarboxylase